MHVIENPGQFVYVAETGDLRLVVEQGRFEILPGVRK
jgi:hypothetical protein